MRRFGSAHVGILLLLLGALSLTWQLWGLRYTNHDDIQFNLYSHLFAGHETDLVTYIAQGQARIQAFVNIPVLLFADGAASSHVYDWLNISSILASYGGLLFLLRTLGSSKSATALVATTLLLFPLHYYYTFPQGYPVMASMGLTCSLVASGLLSLHLGKPSAWRHILSIGLFLCSLWGSEFNLVLHPALLVAPILVVRRKDEGSLAKITFPYIASWIATVAVYWAYSNAMHVAGADPEGRTVASFSPAAWLQTFVILEEKAFLPVALWTGIHLNTAATQGVPRVPPILTFSTITDAHLDATSLTIVFLATWLFFAFALNRIHLTVRAYAVWSFVFVSLLVIPSAVLAVSSHYQTIIRAGYIEGHLSTFYSQLGATGLAVLFFSWVCDLLPRSKPQIGGRLLSSSVLAAMATLTCVYNNVNRQVMNANSQKWQAMKELVEFVDVHHPDLTTHPIDAQAFWTSSGVSVIPDSAGPYYADNYWTTYSHTVLNSALTFRDPGQVNADGVQTSYFATPSGTPVVILYEPTSENGGASVTLIADGLISGTLFYRFQDGSTGEEAVHSSLCSRNCITKWNYSRRIDFSSVGFCPSDREPASLIEQFLGGRGGEYGLPFAMQERAVCDGKDNHSNPRNGSPDTPVLAYDDFDTASDWSKSILPSTAVLKGSYPIEADGICWIAGKATMYLKPPFEHGIQVKGYVPVSVHRKAKPALQDIVVEVHINGQQVASVAETDDKMFDLHLDVPPEARNAVVELELTVSDIVNPARAQLGRDQRDLGVIISAIRVLR